MNPTAKEVKEVAALFKRSIEETNLAQLEVILTKVGRQWIVPHINRVVAMSEDVVSANLEIVPDAPLKALMGQVSSAITSFQDLKAQINASLDISTGINLDAVVNRSRDFSETFFKATQHYFEILKFLTYKDESSVETAVQQSKVEIIESKNIFLKWISEQQAEMAQNIGAAKYADIFSGEAERYKVNSRSWLLFTVILLALTVGLSVALLVNFKETVDSYDNVQLTITKLIITTALFLAINMCLKSYRAQKHNEVINYHRHNALRTFEVFQKVSADEQTKNAVLLEVTRTIFGNQQTGYSSTSDQDGDGVPSKIIEIIKPGSK